MTNPILHKTLSTVPQGDSLYSTNSDGTFALATPSVSENASTATALATPRAINGVNFDGTAAITVTASAGTLTGTTMNASVVASSLTQVGTLAALTVTASIRNTGLVAASYTDDTAAATGGVPVGGLYNTAGAVKVRLT